MDQMVCDISGNPCNGSFNKDSLCSDCEIYKNWVEKGCPKRPGE